MQHNVILPPSRVFAPAGNISVFLAGSIDMGAALNWQELLCKTYYNSSAVTLYNPRRDDWDSSWTQSLQCAQFVEQVNWELDCIDRADFVFMHITAESKAPISLLEFGHITAKSPEKLIISVEPGFWRRGNIEVVCNRLGIELHESLDWSMHELSRKLASAIQKLR